MRDVIAGLVGVGLFLLFVGYYAYRVHSVPLWVVLAIAALLALADYVGTVREQIRRNADLGGGEA
ncbi:hypothetical protein [Inmirania thermothiophila]|uniref:Uncharacterized protein n=1 Tax=Inmirania thermothiophila TaxID=1750597 RepID=A0A3N1Y413_9GAMM|nr:hypothetical protein [Inmirania thermothiophila]ROR32352.1 hypothetical protein EDC57_1550 [Inmirania thermothiophila]